MSVRSQKARLDKLDGGDGIRLRTVITVHHKYPRELLDKFMAENGLDGPECFKLIIHRFGDEDIMAEPKILRQ